MYINSAIILEPEKGQSIDSFIENILDYKKNYNINFENTNLVAKFNDVFFEITAEMNDYNSILQSWESAWY